LVKRLRGLHGAKGRREQGLLLLEGTHLLQEVIRLQLVPSDLVATEAWLGAHGDLVAALSPALTIHPVGPEVLEAVATTAHPDGVVLTLASSALRVPPDGQEFLLVLDGLQDPGNLGTILRTADCAGASGVIFVGPRCDPFDPAFAISGGTDLTEALDGVIQLALAQRTAARDRKDFAASDQIRDGLAALGIIIEDTAQGPRWSISQISEK
jgi:tRNA G18 (ribose-2'-O)-methylase SpoU